MKEWERKIISDKKLGNTFSVVSAGQRYLCNFINGHYIVKNADRTKLTDVSNIIKL